MRDASPQCLPPPRAACSAMTDLALLLCTHVTYDAPQASNMHCKPHAAGMIANCASTISLYMQARLEAELQAEEDARAAVLAEQQAQAQRQAEAARQAQAEALAAVAAAEALQAARRSAQDCV